MSEVVGEELEIFYCYAHEDDALRRELEIHLSGLKRTYHLKRFDDALSAYEHAILLDPSEGGNWYNKSLTLQALNRPKEAQKAREKARQLGYSPT